MPKSKRDKKISLTKTDKKGLALKQRIVEDVRNCIEKYNSVYVFSYKDLRNNKMKEIREEWKPSRFFFGKNRVIAVGLGRKPEEEVQDNLHKLSQYLKGQCGLLFTDSTKKETLDWFEDFSYVDFARAGYVVDQTIKLEEGPMKQFQFSIEPYLRKLGLPVKLEKGVVTLIKDYEVCQAGTAINSDQAKILSLLDYKLAKFTLNLKAMWSKDGGFEVLSVNDDEEDGDDDEEMEDD